MKKLIIFIFILATSLYEVSAQSYDTSMIGFQPVVISQEVPSNVASYIENQVLNVLTSEGIAHTSGDFLFEISVNELSKQLLATAPPRTQLRLEIVVKAIDKSQDVILNSVNLIAAGMDDTESGAYMAAMRTVNFRSRNFMNFVEVSKNRLLEYYGGGYAKAPKEDTPPPPAPEERPAPSIPEERPVSPAPKKRPVDEAPKEYSGVELSDGVFVEFVKIEKKSNSTDIILKFINHNDKDEVISFRNRSHMIVDDSGLNIYSRSEHYLNGANISNDGILLLKGVPVSVRINYSGDVTPQVMFLKEAVRDVTVRIEIK